MRLAVLLSAALLGGCVFVPQTTIAYDEECKVHAKQMTLRAIELRGFGSCAGEGCVHALVAIGIVAAASVVVSGSIVVVGNAVHWLEKQGQCWTK